MRRDEALKLAQELGRRLLARHGEAAVRALGVHGAAARPDAEEVERLDLAVVTAAPEVAIPERTLRYRGVTVEVGAIWGDAYLEEAGAIGPTWPLTSSQYVHHVPLHDPGGFFPLLRQTHERAVGSAPPEAFRAAAGYDLVKALEFHSTARAALARGDAPGGALALRDAALYAALLIGLATRTTFQDHLHALRVAAASAVPPGFAAPYRAAIDPGTAVGAAVEALGQALEALVVMARQDGTAFESDDPEAFL